MLTDAVIATLHHEPTRCPYCNAPLAVSDSTTIRNGTRWYMWYCTAAGMAADDSTVWGPNTNAQYYSRRCARHCHPPAPLQRAEAV